ncbi:hypothetical protein JTE90_010239 [Oedothorax gibbosus]|uniref:Uncharacterized protein n=1 Tax=Oedothorax gibbosus TaxID=931172 RepID=A0AAV6TLK5_9ARAC|nr:hypothetical protein JTE90_010239 [Oedothorax gibbosus]
MESAEDSSDVSTGSPFSPSSPSSSPEDAATSVPPSPVIAVSEASSSSPIKTEAEETEPAAVSIAPAHDSLPRIKISLADLPAAAIVSAVQGRHANKRRTPDSGHCSVESSDDTRKRRSKDDKKDARTHFSQSRQHPYHREQQNPFPSQVQKKMASAVQIPQRPVDRRKENDPVRPPEADLSGSERPSVCASSRASSSFRTRVVSRHMTPPHIQSYLSKHLMNFSVGAQFVLCIRENGFTFTNGFASHCEDHCPNIHKSLIYVVHSLDMGQVICTDTLTNNLLKATIDTLASQNVLRKLDIRVLRDFTQDIGMCYECETECHRFRAVMGVSQLLKFSVKHIPHFL